MEFKTAVFYCLAAILTYAGLRVITARNPVVAVLHLILAFFSAGGVWALLQAEFLAIGIILIYVGAVMVLLLFVVMMLDINLARLREKFWRYLPLGTLVGLIMLFEIGAVLTSSYMEAGLSDAPAIAPGTSNTKEIARLLVSQHAYPFILAGAVLLVATIAAVVLTHRGKRPSKAKDPAEQIRVRAADRVRLVKMDAEARD